MPKIRIALVQFDAVPEQVERNRHKMQSLIEEAAASQARWIVFHEGTICDYTPDVARYAELVPEGKSTQSMAALAQQFNCCICFGLTEREGDKFFISQVFVGPQGFFYRYRKTWLWREAQDEGYRNEWARYDPGTGPELFNIDGVRATCFICADGEAPRCVERAKLLSPQVVFYPNNRGGSFPLDEFAERAQIIGAPMLVTNRIGYSWNGDCPGGNTIYAADGAVLAKANREGREEIVLYDLEI